jgi:hypothetical protein
MGSQIDDRGLPSTEGEGALSARPVPIRTNTPTIRTSAPSPGDPMDVTSPTTVAMGPPGRTSPPTEANGVHEHLVVEEHNQPPSTAAPNNTSTAQTTGQQPKVVQTAFIHKLYKYVVAIGHPFADFKLIVV